MIDVFFLEESISVLSDANFVKKSAPPPTKKVGLGEKCQETKGQNLFLFKEDTCDAS